MKVFKLPGPMGHTTEF